MPPASPDNEQVFLSYSRSDRDACLALRAALEQVGLSVFRDENTIRTGDRWMTRLQEALQGCGAFVVLVGRDGVRRWVGAEVEVALSRHLSARADAERLPIFPVLLEGAKQEDLPPFLALFQSAHWSPAEPLPPGLAKTIKERAIRLETPPAFEGCPFLGLNAFSRADARLFFGRRKETLEALACLGDQREANPEQLRATGRTNYCRWLQIEGNSGAGKSSLVKAGMLPMIEQGAFWPRTGFEHWTVLGPMMPGLDPLAKLAEVLERGLIWEVAQRDTLRRLARLKEDERSLAFALRDAAQDQVAFLLFVDQFEELFTFSEEAARKDFDSLLAYALRDPECPLFLISTARADFLDRYEQIPALQEIYNSHCRRYFLPTISQHGLREVIEQPARLSGLDVSEITTAILDDAREEIGALPLVENALQILWQQREGKRLSGDRYREVGGIAGMLSAEADTLLEHVGHAVPKGKHRALELLLRLTRINDDGRHTRQRISRDEAVLVAGGGQKAQGERVVQLLSGDRRADAPGQYHVGALRLITISTDGPDDALRRYVDIIHETLIRARGKEQSTGKRIGYWPTLYDYVDANRDRDLLRQQLQLQAEQWSQSGWVGHWWYLAGWRDLGRFRRLRTIMGSPEARFLGWSRWVAAAQAVLLLGIAGIFAESAWWANQNHLPPSYILYKPLWMLGYTPLPELVDIEPGAFMMGCQPGQDDAESDECRSNDGAHHVMLATPYLLGRREVTFLEYDYFVWEQTNRGIWKMAYPSDSGWGRSDQPVINIGWDEAKQYATWLGEKVKKKRIRVCRLPTEAEWEYAARAGTTTAYWWGSKFDRHKANCQPTGLRKPAPADNHHSNPWGLIDMLGNVYEWTEDGYAPYLPNPVVDPLVPSDGKSRVVRGGAWGDDPRYCRAASRDHYASGGRGGGLGFRVCCGAPIESLNARPLDAETPKR